ncbi:MAG: aldo/keto reductase [Candidatus Saelkia tenebricola]|nr:aldo/keto reductase [Candidatus Saelkia tenebricola]
MKYTKIRNTDIQPVSRIGLGSWAIGGWLWGGTSEHDAINTILAALERGVNLIDTAPVYGMGKAEEIIGQALAIYGRREDVIIATKVGLEWDGNKIFRNSSKKRILKEIDESLKRLGTDYIDIYQVHWPDASTPIGKTADVMHELYKNGKIRAIGASNYSPQQMDKFREYSPLHTSQPPFNLFEQGAVFDVLPYCHTYGITTLTYGTLCRGLLSGRMKSDTEFKGDDIRKIDPKFQEPNYSKYLNAVEKLNEFTQGKYDKGIIYIAVRWVLDHEGVDIALWGARQPEQLEVVNEIMGWELDREAKNTIEKIIKESLPEPIGAEFMAPPEKS